MVRKAAEIVNSFVALSRNFVLAFYPPLKRWAIFLSSLRDFGVAARRKLDREWFVGESVKMLRVEG
jgi:hypothetical protein